MTVVLGKCAASADRDSCKVMTLCHSCTLCNYVGSMNATILKDEGVSVMVSACAKDLGTMASIVGMTLLNFVESSLVFTIEKTPVLS